jgi:hypothetical protein
MGSATTADESTGAGNRLAPQITTYWFAHFNNWSNVSLRKVFLKKPLKNRSLHRNINIIANRIIPKGKWAALAP